MSPRDSADGLEILTAFGRTTLAKQKSKSQTTVVEEGM